MESMNRRFVVLFDGTGQDGTRECQTSIRKLWGHLCKTPFQYCKYIPGPGSFAASVNPSEIKIYNIPKLYKGVKRMINGHLWGESMTMLVVQAYRSLSQWYIKNNQELKSPKIFIFGFSRGACAARKLMELITECGIPCDGKFVKQVVNAHRKRQRFAIETFRRDGKLTSPLEVDYLGLWDTVNTSMRTFHLNHFASSNLLCCRHAIAKHEIRNFYRPSHIVGKTIKTMVFSGDHGDVGGGHGKEEEELPKVALKWIVEEAVARGLTLTSNDVISDSIDISHTRIHSSATCFSNIFGFLGFHRRVLTGLKESPICGEIERVRVNAQTIANLEEEINGFTPIITIKKRYARKVARNMLACKKFVRDLLNERINMGLMSSD